MTIIKKEYKGERDISADLEIASYITGNTLSIIQAKKYSLYTHRPSYSKPLELANKVKQFYNLPSNWDSYNADKISYHAIEIALQVIARLSIDGLLSSNIDINVFPMRDGGIQFEFDDKDLSYELEIFPEGELRFIEYDEEGDVEEENEDFNLYDLKDKLLGLEYA